MGEVGQVFVTIGAHMDEALAALAKIKQELKGVEGATKPADDKLKKFADTCKATGQQFKDFGKPLMVVGGAITGAFAIAIKKTADLGDEFKDLSQRTGIAVETLSGFKLAADKSGTSIAGFATGMRGLSRVMADAAGGGKETREAFESIGVSVTDAAGNLRPLEEVMLDVADRFKDMPDGAEKSALAMRLFGKSGAELIPMLNMGRKGLEENAAQMRKFGIVTREEAEAGDAFNDAMTDLGAATGGLSRAIVSGLLPPLTKLLSNTADAIAKVSAWAREHKGLTSILSGGVLAIGATATAIGTLAFSIGTVMQHLPKLISGLKVLKALALNPITIVITGLAIAGADIAKSIGEWKRYKDAGTEAMEALKKEASSFHLFGGPSEQAIYRLGEYLERAKDSAIDTKGAFALLGDAFRAIKGAIETGLNTPLANLLGIFKTFGLKTKTELTTELKAAETALVLLKKSSEATPGSIKTLEDKIKGLKEELYGAGGGAKDLADKLGLVLRVDLEKKYQDMLTALTALKGQMTDAGAKKLTDDLIALRAELDGTKPSIVSLDDTLTAFFGGIDQGMSDADVEQIGADFSDMARQAQLDIEGFTQGAADDIKNLIGPAEAVEAKFKLIGDAMGVSAATVQVALYNIQANFLRTIGIIVPLIESLPAATAPAVKTMSNYFDGLMNDIASGFGNTIQEWLSGATTFKDFMVGLWGNIKDAFFRVIGQMVAEWTVKFVAKLIKDAADIGASIAKSIGQAISGIGGAAGSMAGSFLSAASSIANIVTAVASVISLFKKAPTGAGDGMGRVVERQDQQTSMMTRIFEDISNNLKPTLWAIASKSDRQIQALGSANGWLSKISGALHNMKSAANGAVVTSPQMVMTHGTPARPEVILPMPDLKGLMATGGNAGASAPSSIINLNPTFNINTIDRAGVESFIRNDAKPILQNMLDHYDLVPRTGGVRG